MAFGPKIFMVNIEGIKKGSIVRYYFLGLQSHCRWLLLPWIWKTLTPWKKSYDTPKQCIKNQRHTLQANVSIVKAMIFPIVMYGFEGWTRNKAVVVQSLICLWLFGAPMDCSMPGFPVLHHHPEFAQIDVHQVSDAIQQSHSLDPFSSCPQSLPASDSFPVS